MNVPAFNAETYNLNLWSPQEREPGVMKQVKAQKNWRVFLKVHFQLRGIKVSNMRATDST